MSFSTETKALLISQPYKNPCCRRAVLNGILFSKGWIHDEKICVSLENSEVIKYFGLLVKEFFGKDVEFYTSSKGGRAKNLCFVSPACEKYINSLDSVEKTRSFEKCAGCEAAFFSGVFLACGRVSEPKKRYRIELAPMTRQKLLLELIGGFTDGFSLAVQKGNTVLYSSNSTVAEDFFASIGLNTTAFAFMNSKIVKEVMITSKRVAFCEMNNISKSVDAAAKYIHAIESLEKANLLSTLPEELEKTARLRLLYRDYSLARLAAVFTPPISKPGLSHRLNKILEIYENTVGRKK